MKNIFRRIFSVLLSALLVLSLLAGCTSTKENDETNSANISQDSSGEQVLNDSSAAAGENASAETGAAVKSVGKFSTKDINQNDVTQDIFKENELTMVNVFATWCSPCVAEMPDLEKLHQQVKDKNVGVVGIVLDVLNESGEIVPEDLERAQLLVKRTGVTYPVLMPDSTYLNGRLIGIDAIPETFFVDKEGNIVGESYSGSGSLEDWTEVVEKELANLKEGA